MHKNEIWTDSGYTKCAVPGVLKDRFENLWFKISNTSNNKTFVVSLMIANSTYCTRESAFWSIIPVEILILYIC